MVAVSFLRGPTSVGGACSFTTRRQGAADPDLEDNMPYLRMFLLALLTVSLVGPGPAHAQVTLTMSSWVSPQHHLTSVVLQGWATEVEKATNGRVKVTMLPKHPSAPPGTFDAERDVLVVISYSTASTT